MLNETTIHLQRLFDETGQLLGVAGVDVALDHGETAKVEAPEGQPRPLYAHPGIVTDAQARKFGYREVQESDQELWIVCDDYETLGWSYVVKFAPEF